MIGVVGLDLYGTSLSLNIAQQEKVQIYNPIYYSKIKKLQRQNPKHTLEGRLLGSPTLEHFVDSFDKNDQNVILSCVNGEKNATTIIQQLANLLGKGDCILDFGKTANEEAIKQRSSTCGLNHIEYMDCSIVSQMQSVNMDPSILCSGGSTIASEELLTSISSNILYIDDEPGGAKYIQMLVTSLESSFLHAICDVYAYCNFDQVVLERILKRFAEHYPASCPLIGVVTELCRNPRLARISGSCTVNKTLHRAIKESLERGTQFAVQGSSILNCVVANKTVNTYIDQTTTQPDEVTACNALLFTFSTIILETMNLLEDDPRLNFNRLARFLQHRSCAVSCSLIGKNKEQLNDIMDVTYTSAKKMTIHCIENHRAVPVISNAVNEYNSVQNPRKATNVLMATNNYMYGEPISYLQM